MSSTAEHPLLNDRDLARLTKFSVQTIQRRRLRGDGPPSIKIGGSVRYRWEDVMRWLDAQSNGGGEQRIREGEAEVSATA